MDEIHWSVWVSLSIAVAILAWLVRPPPGEDPFRDVDELQITGGDALGVAVVLSAVGLAIWLVYYLVKLIFWS